MLLNEIKNLTEERDGGVLKRAAEIVASELSKLFKSNPPVSNGSNGMTIATDGYKGSMRKALDTAAGTAIKRVKKELGVDIRVNTDDPYEIGVMKKSLKEEALDTVKAEDLWADNKDAVSEYRDIAEYLVRQVPDSTPPKYEAFRVIADQRKPYGKYTAAELNKALKPIRAGQKPDAEGFTTYVSADTVEAFQYQGDPIKIMLDDLGRRLNKGDYVIRSNDGNDFNYTVDTAADFESSLTKI